MAKKNPKMIPLTATNVMLIVVAAFALVAITVTLQARRLGGDDQKVKVVPSTQAVSDDKSIDGKGTVNAAKPMNTPPDIAKLSADDQRGLTSYIKYTDAGIEYHNDLNHFSLTLPKSWGNVTETYLTPASSLFLASVRLSAENDAEHYVTIQLTKQSDSSKPEIVDYPQTFIMHALGYSFFYLGAGDYAGMPGQEDPKLFQFAAELKDIIKTFKAN